MTRLTRLGITLLLLCVLTGRADAAVVGAPPVVVLAGFTTGTAHTTLAAVTQDMATRYFPALWTDSSYGVFRPTITNVYDWLEVPAGTWCGQSITEDSTFGRAVEAAALAAGITFPTGVIPVVIAPECGHVENRYVSSLPNTYNGFGIFSDGKLLNESLGEILGLPIARAINTPPNPINNWDPFTPMGFTDQPHRLSGIETLQLGWITNAQVFTGSGTHVVEAMEVVPGTATKLWFVQGTGVNIDARRAGTTVVPFIHAGHAILDLEPTSGNQYALPVGQIFVINGVGIRNEGASANGVTVSTFPYTGPSTVTCVGGAGALCQKTTGGSTSPPPQKPPPPPPPSSDCTKLPCTPPPPPPPPPSGGTPPKCLYGAIAIDADELHVCFQPNSGDGGRLAGIASLTHTSLPTLNAFTFAGAQPEHIISGHAQGSLNTADPTTCWFTPRYGSFTVTKLDDRTVRFDRAADQDHCWPISWQILAHVSGHAIDFTTSVTVTDATPLGPENVMGLFFANYMSLMAELGIRFMGITGPGDTPHWILANPPYPGGGYASAGWIPDASRMNQPPAEYPKFTEPFYCGQSNNGMMFGLMFDQSVGTEFVMMKWIVKNESDPTQWKPALDFVNWFTGVQTGQTYTAKSRLVWFPATSCDVVRAEYFAWVP